MDGDDYWVDGNNNIQENWGGAKQTGKVGSICYLFITYRGKLIVIVEKFTFQKTNMH